MKKPQFLLLFVRLLASSFLGVLSSRVVRLGSIEIYDTHEWLPSGPTVYFQCQGENRTVLPDLKDRDVLYTFKGEESWQPLTELQEKKCKRCGLYERDPFKPDDVFDEWELCPADFVDGKYVHFKNKEFNATFICLQCTSSADSQDSIPNKVAVGKKTNRAPLVILICIAVLIVVGIGMTVVYKYWQRRKREQDEARFLKLFEEGDDVEDELGIGPV